MKFLSALAALSTLAVGLPRTPLRQERPQIVVATGTSLIRCQDSSGNEDVSRRQIV